MAIFSRYIKVKSLQLFSCDRPREWNPAFYIDPRSSDNIPFWCKDDAEFHGVLTLMAVNRRSVCFPLRSREVVSTFTVSIVA